MTPTPEKQEDWETTFEKRWKVARGPLTVTIYGRVGDSPDWSVEIPTEMWDDMISDISALLSKEREREQERIRKKIKAQLIYAENELATSGDVGLANTSLLAVLASLTNSHQKE